MATKKETASATVVLVDEELDIADFTPIVVEEVQKNSLVKVTPKIDFKIHIGKNRYVFTKDKSQYVSAHDEELIRKDGARLY